MAWHVLAPSSGDRPATGRGCRCQNPDVLAQLPLEFGGLFNDVPLDLRRVVPHEGLFQGRRLDDLGVLFM